MCHKLLSYFLLIFHITLHTTNVHRNGEDYRFDGWNSVPTCVHKQQQALPFTIITTYHLPRLLHTGEQALHGFSDDRLDFTTLIAIS